MQSTRSSSARNAEREFLDSIRGPAPTLASARAVQQRIDDARHLRIPVADVLEVPFEALTSTERNSFFGAFDDTLPGELA